MTHIALNSTEAQLLNEFALKILDDELLCANGQRLALCFFEVLCLADIGEEADDLMPLLDEPGKDHAGVQAAGISKQHLFLGRHVVREVVPGCLEVVTGQLRVLMSMLL